MITDIADNAKAWRTEIRHLFGLSWDRFIEWVIIAWLSAWIWTAWTVSNAIVFPTSGPITWISEVIRAFGVQPARWLLDVPIWLTDPQRGMLLPIGVIASAVLATLSLHSYDLTGLRVLALACALVAVEIHRSMLPMLWIVLLAAIPFLAALGFSFLPQDRDHDVDEREWSAFTPEVSVRFYLARVLGLFVMPLAAPVFLLFAVVNSYRVEREYRPADDLASVAAQELVREVEQGKRLSTSDPLTVTSALVAAITSISPTTNSRRVAAAFDYRIRERRYARNAGRPRLGRS